jgi:hypothetical protein
LDSKGIPVRIWYAQYIRKLNQTCQR